MTVKIATLGSGSRGNCYYIESPQARILIDAGLSYRQIQLRLNNLGKSVESLTAVVITHEHIDHIAGLRPLTRATNLPVWYNEQTAIQVQKRMGSKPESHVFSNGNPFTIKDIIINPFSVSHDAIDPVGLHITIADFHIGVVQDLGFASTLVQQKIKHCNLLFLEANHDVELLMNGPYPWVVKNRIRSRMGHLSNEQACELLHRTWHENLQCVMLCHLSEQNNNPGLARQTFEQVLQDHDAQKTRVVVAQQNTNSDLYEFDSIHRGGQSCYQDVLYLK